jgi:hypothetical protein
MPQLLFWIKENHKSKVGYRNNYDETHRFSQVRVKIAVFIDDHETFERY